MQPAEKIKVDTTTVLEQIFERKKEWVADRKAKQPLDSFINDVSPADRDFYEALSNHNNHFILECKRSSPSSDKPLRENYDIEEIAKIFGKYADVISVQTEESFFQGNLEHIPLVKKHANQPVLCKDFIFDPYQVYLARYYQADAILLAPSVLEEEQFTELMELAHELKMGVLTEVSNTLDLEMAIDLGAKVISINNRNSRDLTVNMNNTKKLAPKVPKDRIVVAESGLHYNYQVRNISQYAHAFLVGTSLMEQENLEIAVRNLVFGNNKVCGLTRNEDAVVAYQAGARYGGLHLNEGSHRYITLEQAKEVRKDVPLNWVGVFRDTTVDQIVDYVKQLDLYGVQLNGMEDHVFVADLRSKLPESTQIWRVFGVENNVLPEIDTTNADAIMLDTKTADRIGETGIAFDWELLYKVEIDVPLILGGGLGMHNLEDAMLLPVRGFNISTSLESSPGIKDHAKVHELFRYLRTYNNKSMRLFRKESKL